MPEIFYVAFWPVNLVFTLLLILLVLYWLTVIFGALDVDFLDVDWGSDLEADADADVDLGGGVTWLRAVLGVFYVGQVPVTVILSILIVSMWAISVLGNYYFNPAQGLLAALAVLGVNFAASLAIVKIVGAPLRRVFGALNKDYNAPRSVIGRIGVVTTTTVSSKLGQVEVATGGAPIVLNVVTETGEELRKGDEAVVVRRDDERGVYVIARVELERK